MKAKRRRRDDVGTAGRCQAHADAAPDRPRRSPSRRRRPATTRRRRRPTAAVGAATAAIDLSVDLGRGLVLPNPILVASGTFGYGVEYGDVVDVQRLGGDLLQGHDPQGRASATRRRG